MTVSRHDVLKAVRAAFPDGEEPAVLAALIPCGTESCEPEREWVQLAIAELSRGNGDKFLELVQCAKTDYWDILAWKQLGALSDSQGEQLRNEARRVLDARGGKRPGGRIGKKTKGFE